MWVVSNITESMIIFSEYVKLQLVGLFHRIRLSRKGNGGKSHKIQDVLWDALEIYCGTTDNKINENVIVSRLKAISWTVGGDKEG